MTYKLIFLSAFYLWAFQFQAQNTTKELADVAKESGDLERACRLLRLNLKDNPNDYLSTYDLACNYALLKNNDSSFFFLHKAVAIKADFNILNESQFYNLISDRRWIDIQHEAGDPYLNSHPNYDKETCLMLTRILIIDQAYYWETKLCEAKKDTALANYYWHLKDSLNNINQHTLIDLIDKKGWPTISGVGPLGSMTSFLVIQHSDLSMQKKYIQTIVDLAKKKEVAFQDMALMTDRILVYEKKKQLYGSQVDPELHRPYPIEDEKNVDKRRTENGMVPLDVYLNYFGIKYECPK